jgi:hypothetical protein
VRPSAPDAYELLFNDPHFLDPLTPDLNRRDVADLAEVDTTFRPVGPPGEYPAGLVYQSLVTGLNFVSRTPQQVPGSTEVLMTAAPDVRWAHCIEVPANAYWDMCDEELRSYGRGERDRVEFGASLRPEPWDPRHDPFTFFITSGLGDGGGHAGPLLADAIDSSAFTLWRDGRLVARRDGSFAYFPLPNAPGRFRLEHELALRDVFPRSHTAHTAWEFDSAPGKRPPLLMIDYDADTDALGRVADRRTLRLDLRARHVSGAEAPERIARMQLWWSTDGGQRWEWAWTRRRGQASFEASVRGTALRTGKRVSLRVVAEDAAGNTVEQTVHDIYPVG